VPLDRDLQKWNVGVPRTLGEFPSCLHIAAVSIVKSATPLQAEATAPKRERTGDGLKENPSRKSKSKKKADVVEYPKEFDHVGLLVNEPPGLAGPPFT
jgi:hypothetical protein